MIFDQFEKFREDNSLHVKLVSMHILIAEDNPTNAKVMQRILKRLNHTAVVAEDGSIAVETLKTEGAAFDVILMDLQMPNLDGFDAARKIIAEIEGHPPIIACSANAFDTDREAARAAGMVDFIAKPVTSKVLEHVLSGVVVTAVATANPVADDGDDGAIDWEHFEMVIDGGDKEAVEIFDDFCESTPRLIAEMNTAEQEKNWQLFASLAHQIKGTFATFGLVRLSQRMNELQQGALSETIDLSSNWYSELLQVYTSDEARLKKSIEAVLTSY